MKTSAIYRPRLLDLFCGEGGASMGYHRAGFDVVGVDERPMPRYPFEFHQGDATTWSLDGFDAVHASPPCKDHTDLAAQSGGDGTAWMLPHTIERLRASGLPFVVENVEGAERHMDGAVMLCGSMFGLGAWVKPGPPARRLTRRILRRHRLFLSDAPLMAPGADQCSRRPVGGVYGTGGGGQMTRGYKFTAEQSRIAMEMPWASRDGLSQAIPPSYTRFIGEQLMAHLQAVAA